ncbi:MAG: hypothetical protein EBX52_02040 [Proteobacteria bacterium]|nr:hypothetical protein [Pseudomonadota bacterium]
MDEAAQRASDIASKYKEVKANADAAAANAKEIAAGIATQKKVVDGLIAAKAKEDAAAAAKLVGMFSDDGTNSNGLTFKQEIQEQLPRVMGAKGMDGPNVLTITDSSYDQVQCRYGITWDAFGREWRDAKLSLMGKKKVWLMPIDAEAPNGRYYLSCKAIQKDAAIYSGTFEFIMQEWMSGTDWAKSRCDFPVTGISDQTYFAAAAKVLSAKGVVQSVGLVPDPEAEEMSVAVFEEPRAVLAKKDAYAEERVLSRAVKSDFPLSTLKPFEIAEEGYRTGWEVSRKWRKKGIRAFNTVSQPYFGNFGKAQFVGASVSKKISMSPDGKFLLVRRGWSNPGSGCNLPGVMGAVKRQANSSSPMRWLKTRFLKPIFVEGLKTALFPMSKTAPSRGGKNVYNTNIKTGTVFVMNSKGQGILMDDKGTVTRRFTNAPRYLKRMFKRHSLVGDVRELGFKREKH